MEDLNKMFKQRCANIVCNVCEMGCSTTGKAECAERYDVFSCDIVKEKTNEIFELYTNITERIFKKDLIGGNK